MFAVEGCWSWRLWARGRAYGWCRSVVYVVARPLKRTPPTSLPALRWTGPAALPNLGARTLVELTAQLPVSGCVCALRVLCVHMCVRARTCVCACVRVPSRRLVVDASVVPSAAGRRGSRPWGHQGNARKEEVLLNEYERVEALAQAPPVGNLDAPARRLTPSRNSNEAVRLLFCLHKPM